MSIKRQLKFKYANLVNSLQTISLPVWMTSTNTRLGLLSIIFIFSVAYVINTTTSATSGYKMSNLERQTASLESDVQELQVEIADNSSIGNISARVAKLNMVETDSIKYLKVSGGLAVAKK